MVISYILSAILTIPALLFTVQAGATSNRMALRCGGGGEGPKPFEDISAKILAGTSLIRTPGGLERFVFWEGANTLMYRSPENQLTELTLPSQTARVIGVAEGEISQVIDGSERYLLDEQGTSYFDRKTGAWSHFSVDASPLRPLFWHRKLLYLLNVRTSGSTSEFNFYRYRPGSDTAVRTCSLQAAEMGLRLAHGHEYPFLFLYQTRMGNGGPYLSIYKLDVRTCDLGWKFDFQEPMEGAVTDVYRFESLDSIAVKIEHPTKSLLWESPSGCRYFDLQGQAPIIGNFRRAIITTWGRDTGLSVIDLDSAQRGRLLKDFPFDSLGAKDVWLSEGADRLFIAPVVHGESARSLLELKLSPTPGS